jgi:hypothetical protein
MAGLLDIFGTSGTETLGLLGMSRESIQGSRDDAQAQALYALAGRLFQGGNTGASIAQGLQQGQQAYKSALQGQMQEQLQGVQLQDLLRKRKQEQEALARQAMIERAVAGSYRPAMAGTPAQMVEEDGRYMGETPAVAGRAAGLDLQSLAPILQASPEGRKTLAELMTAQKAMRPETFSLTEGAQQFERDPFTGQVVQVATGAPKREPTTADIQGYNLAKSQGFGGSFVDYQTALKKAGAGSTVVYPPGALVPDKATAKDAQSALLQASSRLSLYNQIDSQFKPEYFQPTFRTGQAWNAIKEKAGTNLTPSDQKTLADFSQFRQNSVNNLSQTIKDLTGASMGVEEAKRIESGMPSVGTGLFSGDSPTEFKSKLDNVTKQLRNVEARNAYILRKGLSFKDVSLDSVPRLINNRASELAKEYNVDLAKASPTQLNAIKRQLSVEFGITAD